MENNPFGLGQNDMEQVLQNADLVAQQASTPAIADNDVLAAVLGVVRAAKERGWDFSRVVTAAAFTYGRSAAVIHVPGQ